MGSLTCLNVAGGDIKITFDTDDAAEAIRAKRIIEEMLKRGYALLVEVNGKFRRAKGFDAKVGEYIIADYDPTVEAPDEQSKETTAESPKIKSKPGHKRLPMAKTKAVGVAPSAGG